VSNEAFNKLQRLTVESVETMGKTVLGKGPSGSGKTTLALSFPEPLIFAYADKNRDTVGQALLSGRKVDPILIRHWGDYQDVFVPTVKNRLVEANTIVVDTIDFMATLGTKAIKGTKSGLSQNDWGAFFDKMWDTTSDLTEAASPTQTHPGYNIVFLSHTKQVTDEDGKLLRHGCSIPGSFVDKIEDFFNYVLICEAGVVGRQDGNTIKKERQFKILSVPPNRYHTCKGGKLPPEIIVPEGESAFEKLNQIWKIKE
jgi:hypothetical protein